MGSWTPLRQTERGLSIQPLPPGGSAVATAPALSEFYALGQRGRCNIDFTRQRRPCDELGDPCCGAAGADPGMHRYPKPAVHRHDLDHRRDVGRLERDDRAGRCTRVRDRLRLRRQRQYGRRRLSGHDGADAERYGVDAADQAVRLRLVQQRHRVLRRACNAPGERRLASGVGIG